jgi:peptidoglycan hydrolase-like protein with peptidoglycan-binding domain
MRTPHHPFFAILFTALMASAPLAVAQQGSGQGSESPGGNESGASGTTGDLSAPQGEKSSSDVQDPTSGTSGTMAPAVAALSPEQVRRVQERLVEFGHDPGTVDGVMGEKTRQALRSFQQARGLEPTGEPDGRTLAELGVE